MKYVRPGHLCDTPESVQASPGGQPTGNNWPNDGKYVRPDRMSDGGYETIQPRLSRIIQGQAICQVEDKLWKFHFICPSYFLLLPKCRKFIFPSCVWCCACAHRLAHVFMYWLMRYTLLKMMC